MKSLLFQPPQKDFKRVFEYEITVSGAVKNPGIYRGNSEMTVEDILLKAEPLSNADLRKIKQKQKIFIPMDLIIPYRQT